MDRKEIQEQRMRGYFIGATREILKGEGLKSVNVRAIAEKAGYSYATLYNYFRDVKELIFICVGDFQQEAESFIQEKTAGIAPGKERIFAISKALIDYFIQYPGIFELFYLERLSNLSGKQPVAELISYFPGKLTSTDWDLCIEQNIYSKTEADNRLKLLNSSLTGLLLMYLNRLHPGSYNEFIRGADIQLRLILS